MNFLYLKPLLPLVVKMLKERLNKEVLKYFKELYKNLWFLIKKKKLREYRLINSAIYLNTIMRQNANLLLLVNKFINKFIDCYIISLINLYSGYN
jgi:hypothetical protein